MKRAAGFRPLARGHHCFEMRGQLRGNREVRGIGLKMTVSSFCAGREPTESGDSLTGIRRLPDVPRSEIAGIECVMTCRIGRRPPYAFLDCTPEEAGTRRCLIVIEQIAARDANFDHRNCRNCEEPMRLVLFERQQQDCTEHLEQRVYRCEDCLSTIRFIFKPGPLSARPPTMDF